MVIYVSNKKFQWQTPYRSPLFKIQVSGVYLINQRVYIDIVLLICNLRYFLEQLPNQLQMF